MANTLLEEHLILKHNINQLKGLDNITRDVNFTGNFTADEALFNGDITLATTKNIQMYDVAATPIVHNILTAGNEAILNDYLIVGEIASNIGIETSYLVLQNGTEGIFFRDDTGTPKEMIRYDASGGFYLLTIGTVDNTVDMEFKVKTGTITGNSSDGEEDYASLLINQDGTDSVLIGQSGGTNVFALYSSGVFNFYGNGTQNFAIEHGSSFPVSPFDYQVFIKEDENKVYFYNPNLVTPGWQEI